MKTKAKILYMALEMFNAQSLGQVGMRDIARGLDISVGNLSYHFPRKRDIILALMEQIGSQNEEVYQAYLTETPSLAAFLSTLKEIFQNQYNHRGLLVGNHEIATIIKEHFDYASVEHKRKALFQEIFNQLKIAGELKLGEEDVAFMVNFMTLFGRFWILEAAVSHSDKSPEHIIQHYMQLIQT